MADFYTKLLQRHLDKDCSILERRIIYTSSELICLISNAKDLISKEPSLVALNPPVVIVGDLHGQFYDMLRMFELFNKDGKAGCLQKNFMFLGDYVDRGRRSLECISLALTLKMMYPKNYMLLRGNHECPAINRFYGFYDELCDRFETKEADLLFKNFNELFSFLPLAGLVGKKILCMHGGIGPDLESLDDIRKIQRPLEDPMDNHLAMDLLWADPMVGLKGFLMNETRGVSVYFGEDTVKNICKQLKVDLIVRAHQVMLNGYNFFCNRRLLTVFSAPRYFTERPNKAAVLEVDVNGKCNLKVFCPSEEGKEGQSAIRRDIDECNTDETTSYMVYRPLPKILNANNKHPQIAPKKGGPRPKVGPHHSLEKRPAGSQQNSAMGGKSSLLSPTTNGKISQRSAVGTNSKTQTVSATNTPAPKIKCRTKGAMVEKKRTCWLIVKIFQVRIPRVPPQYAAKFIWPKHQDKEGNPLPVSEFEENCTRVKEKSLIEFELMDRAEGRHIVDIYCRQELAVGVMLLMECVWNSTKDVIDYGLQMLDGLTWVHSKNIMHGDVKPGNTILFHDGSIKLGDFGSSFDFVKHPRTRHLGTRTFSSMDNLKRSIKLKPQDDLISAIHSMVHLLTPLPWSGSVDKKEALRKQRKSA